MNWERNNLPIEMLFLVSGTRRTKYEFGLQISEVGVLELGEIKSTWELPAQRWKVTSMSFPPGFSFTGGSGTVNSFTPVLLPQLPDSTIF